jgi:signal transduction histidine kinase
LFEPFRHGQGAYGSGLGLGLYIVREIVRAHEGSVEVACDGKLTQTTFTVRWPKHPGSRAAPELVSEDLTC